MIEFEVDGVLYTAVITDQYPEGDGLQFAEGLWILTPQPVQ